MKKIIFFVAALLISASVVIPGCAKKEKIEVIELSLNLGTPPTHVRFVKLIEPWIKRIEERTNGRVKIVPYHGAALSSMAENYNSVVRGLADLGESFLGAAPSQFPMWEAISKYCTPSILMENPSEIWWHLYRNVPEMQGEFSDTKVLYLHGSPPSRFATAKKPVKTLDDIKGLKITVTGGGLDPAKLSALGAAPEALPMGDFYMALEKGVVDGAGANYELMKSRNYGEVLKHVTNFSLNYGSFYMVMNKDVWNNLPADIQEIFEEESGDKAVRLHGEAAMKNDLEAKELFEKEMGGTSYYLSEDELAELDSIILPIIEQDIERLEQQGYPMKTVYERYLKFEKEQQISWP
jgi:TRAP-type C4-dicarboxylate transport system substrate-binding protein